MNLNNIELITFDCYGTLIDWETGILNALEPVFERHSVHPTRQHILRAFGDIERRVEAGSYQPYRDVLREVARRLFDRAGVIEQALSERELGVLAISVGDWPAFDETPRCLRALKATGYQLGVLSNIDDDMFARSLPRLGVDLDLLVTAQQVRSYKPAPAHFREALKRAGLDPSRILHVAESRFHDVAPARELGIKTVWINRSQGNPSASGESDSTPDHTVRSLEELLDWLGVPAT